MASCFMMLHALCHSSLNYLYFVDKKVVINDCHLGRFGTLLSVRSTGAEPSDSMETLTKGLCQHIIACSPTSIGDPEDDPVAKKEDEERLVLQEYALEEDTLVREILELNQLTVTDFVRFECGEVLPEEND